MTVIEAVIQCEEAVAKARKTVLYRDWSYAWKVLGRHFDLIGANDIKPSIQSLYHIEWVHLRPRSFPTFHKKHRAKKRRRWITNKHLQALLPKIKVIITNEKTTGGRRTFKSEQDKLNALEIERVRHQHRHKATVGSANGWDHPTEPIEVNGIIFSCDVLMIPLVRYMNSFPGITTSNCCQGGFTENYFGKTVIKEQGYIGWHATDANSAKVLWDLFRNSKAKFKADGPDKTYNDFDSWIATTEMDFCVRFQQEELLKLYQEIGL